MGTAYDKHVAKTQPLVAKWDAEAVTLQKILCYCNAWLSGTDARDSRSQHNATHLEACKDQTHTPVPVNYGTPAEKVALDLTSVANYPGTSGFTTQEYSNFREFTQAAVPCPQASTAAPTTVVPSQAYPFALGAQGSADCPDGHTTISQNRQQRLLESHRVSVAPSDWRLHGCAAHRVPLRPSLAHHNIDCESPGEQFSVD